MDCQKFLEAQVYCEFAISGTKRNQDLLAAISSPRSPSAPPKRLKKSVSPNPPAQHIPRPNARFGSAPISVKELLKAGGNKGVREISDADAYSSSISASN